MKLIKLTSNYKCEWESLISEFKENEEKLTPLAMKEHANTIIKNSGVLENEVVEDGKVKQRYWVHL